LHTVSEHINYRTTHPCTSIGRLQILRKLAEVQHKYHRRGFNITEFHADNEFDKIVDDLLPAGVGIKWKSGVLDIVLLFDLQIILILIQIHQNERKNTYCI